MKHVMHGMWGSRTYQIYKGMLARCNNQNRSNYKYYGAIGIKVCKRWLKFHNFLEDMGEAPRGKSIDRKYNTKNYSPSNCKWATIKEQNRNTSQNHMITYKGKTQCLSAWCEELNLKYNLVAQRIRKYKWDVENAFTQKVWTRIN